MDLEEAGPIVSACIAHTLHQAGATEELPPSLEKYSLQELIDANHRVAEENAKPMVNGKGGMRLMCDDRLVAALYTLYHYEGCQLDEVRPIAATENKEVCCLVVERKDGDG